MFRQAWEGRSYPEIAASSGFDTGYIKNVGSRLWKLLSNALGQQVTKSNLRAVLRQQLQKTKVVTTALTTPLDTTNVNTGTQLSMIVQIYIPTGMEGIGKTALSTQLAAQIQPELEYLIWRSLRNESCLENRKSTLSKLFSSDFSNS